MLLPNGEVMQRYHLTGVLTEVGDDSSFISNDVYRAPDVHSLLTMLRAEIVAQSGLRTQYQDWSDALKAIDSSLGKGANDV